MFDTNVLISAALFARSIPRQAFDLAFSRGKLLLSNTIAEEIADVFNRPKFDRYVSSETRELFLSLLLQSANFVEIDLNINECRDSKDNKFLELAICGRANFIISGDEDLLVLNPFRQICIITPKNFLELYS